MSNRNRFCIRIFIFLLILLTLYACSDRIGISQQGKIHPDYITADTYDELTSLSKIIVTGEFYDENEIINMARNIDDITLPDKNIFIVGQVYDFKVDQYLKGEGASTIKILQPEGILGERSPKTTESLQKAKENYQFVPIIQGKKYILFLDFLAGFPKEELFVGPVHPWRFDISNPDKVVPESPWENAKGIFTPQSLNVVMDVVKNPKSTETPQETRIPYPPP